MARMTATQMASELHKRGIKAELIFRKEGGARITNINGKSFKGSKGNAEARRLLGIDLSEKQKKHLKSIKTKKGQFGNKNPYKAKTQEINKAFDEAVKEGRFKYKPDKKTGKKKKPPKVSYKKVQYRLKKYGQKQTEEYLERTLRYAKGYAYDEAIEAFIQRLEADLAKRNSNYVISVINALKAMLAQGKRLKEKDFEDLQSLTYSWEDGVIGTKDFKMEAMLIIAKAE